MDKNLNIRIGADAQKVGKAVNNTNKKLQGLKKNLTGLGAKMSAVLTVPIDIIGGQLMNAYNTQIQAETKLASAIRSTGGDVEKGMEGFKEYTSRLQAATNIGDETTLKLATLGKQMGLNNDQTKSAVTNALAFSDALGVSRRRSMRMAAQLEQGSTRMLERHIEKLKQTSDGTEKMAIAQDFAENALKGLISSAQKGTEPLKALGGHIGDLQEQFGKTITEAVNPFINLISEMVLALQNTSEGFKTVVVGIAAVAASIGPVLALIGVFTTTILPAMTAGLATLTTTVIPAIGSAAAALVGPIGIAIAAFAGIAAAVLYIWDNWEAITERITDTALWRNLLIDIAQLFIKYNPFDPLIEAYNQLANYFGGNPIESPFEDMRESLEGLRQDQKDYEHEFGSFSDALSNGFEKAKNGLKELAGFDPTKGKDDGPGLNKPETNPTYQGDGEGDDKELPPIEMPEGGLVKIDKSAEDAYFKEKFKSAQESFRESYEKAAQTNKTQLTKMRSQFLLVQTDLQKIGNGIKMHIGQSMTSALEQGILSGQNFGKAMIDMLKKLIAKLIAAAAVAATLAALTGGSFMSGFKAFSGFGGGGAEGMSAGAGAAMQGAGAAVPAMTRPSGMSSQQNINVEGRISGEDIRLSNQYAEQRNQRLR